MTSPVPPSAIASTLTPPPQVATVMVVTTPSGQTIEVLGGAERSFYEGQSQRYQDENKFENTSDLLDLDRLMFLELLVFRATSWLGKGAYYDNTLLTDRAEQDARKSLKENSELISRVKTDLGITKAARDRADFESVGAYLTQLKQRAREFGIHRETQLTKGITLMHELFSIIGAYDRADAAERTKLGFENDGEILEWIRDVMKPEFEKVDRHFATNVQRYWTDL